MRVVEEQAKGLEEFLVEKTKDCTSNQNIMELAREFIENFGISESPETINSRIIRFRVKAHTMDYSNETKIRLLFALGASIDEGLLEELRSRATVHIDHKRRIKIYEANDGSLMLYNVVREPRRWGIKRKSEAMNQGSIGALRTSNSPNADLEDPLDELCGDSGGDALLLNNQEQQTSWAMINTDVKNESEQQFVSFFNESQPSTSCSMDASTAVMSATGFLKLLQNVLETLDLPVFYELHQTIDQKLEVVQKNNVNVHVYVIKDALQSIFQLSIRHATTLVGEEESVNLRDFLLILRTTIFHLSNPDIIEFKKSFSTLLKSSSVGNENTRIPLKKLQCGIEYALEYVLP